jgi:FtsH-binding integral membrane protein
MDRSSLSALDKSTNDERQYNLNFLKMLYTLFALELLIVFTWSSFVVGYPESFDWYKNAWWFGIIGLILAILILLFTMFGNASRQPPVNLVVYFLFTIMLAIGLGWLCIVDQSRLVYFTLATVTMIAVGFMMYAM